MHRRHNGLSGEKKIRGEDFLFLLLERHRFAVLRLFLFRKGFAKRAGILAAEGHVNGLAERDDLGIFPDHVGPGDALQDVPLPAAGKKEGGKDREMGQTSHKQIL